MKHLRTLICLAVVFSPSITQAQVTRSTDTLTPAQSKYVSPAQFHQAYANGIILTNPSHNRFLQKKPVHPPNKIGKSITEKFMSTVTADVTINGTTVTISAPAKVKVKVTFTSQTGNVRVFTTQMLELTVKGGSLPPGAELSLIPGQPTTGQTTITTLANGEFLIDSYFDVLSRISLDKGKTWSNTTAPGHMVITDD